MQSQVVVVNRRGTKINIDKSDEVENEKVEYEDMVQIINGKKTNI